MRELPVVEATERLERATALDPAIATVRGIVNRVIRPQGLRDVLHGVPIGHPVHPVAILVPTGAWISAAVLDLLPGSERAARTLIGVGILGVAPAATSGVTDWSTLPKSQQRVGLVHWAANITAIGLYSASYVQRRRGHLASGKVLSFLGLAVVSGGGYLGGHMAYRLGTSDQVTADEPDFAEAAAADVPADWHTVGLADSFPDGRVTSAEVAGVSIVLVRQGVHVDALIGTCSFCGDSLAGGTVVDGTLECPLDGSIFDLATGEVVRGPAVSPQPRFDGMVNAGMVEVRAV